MSVWEEEWVFDGRWLKVAPAQGEVYGHTFACCDYSQDDDGPARAKLAAAARADAPSLTVGEPAASAGNYTTVPFR